MGWANSLEYLSVKIALSNSDIVMYKHIGRNTYSGMAEF